MSPELVSILVLIAMFAAATFLLALDQRRNRPGQRHRR